MNMETELRNGPPASLRKARAHSHLAVQLLTKAELVVGFNHLHFDYGVLEGYTVLDLGSQTVNLDLMVDLKEILGRRIGLDRLEAGSVDRRAGQGQQMQDPHERGTVAAREQRHSRVTGSRCSVRSWYTPSGRGPTSTGSTSPEN